MCSLFPLFPFCDQHFLFPLFLSISFYILICNLSFPESAYYSHCKSFIVCRSPVCRQALNSLKSCRHLHLHSKWLMLTKCDVILVFFFKLCWCKSFEEKHFSWKETRTESLLITVSNTDSVLFPLFDYRIPESRKREVLLRKCSEFYPIVLELSQYL